MKNTSTITSLLAALLVFAVALSTPNAVSAQTLQNAQTGTPSALAAAVTPEPAPLSAPEAVFYMSGVLDAQADGAVRLANTELAAPPFTIPVGFRQMSYTNELVANLLRFKGYTIGAAYMQGRADAFKALADLLGEP